MNYKQMNYNPWNQLIGFAVSLLIAALIWRYYRGRSFAESERYSTFGPRFWTGSVDSCVLWPIGFITEALLFQDIPRTLAAVVMAVQSLGWLVYTVVMHVRYGQTVGKMVTAVKVVDLRTEGGLSWSQAWIREGLPVFLSLGVLGYEIHLVLSGHVSAREVAAGALVTSRTEKLFAILPGLWFLAEVLTMLTNQRRRALHDFIAGTIVIRLNTGHDNAQPGAAPKSCPATPPGIPGAMEGPRSVS